jgi:hypothetical protein
MGVFLRWGVFGILAVAAMLYAYNASKRMAEHQQSKPALQKPLAAPGDASEESYSEDRDAEDGQVAVAAEPGSPACDEELHVADIALKARREDQPLDRLMRSQEIAFQSDARRRQRLEDVARKWFEWRGAEPDAATLRGAVLKDCWRFSPAP